MRPLALTLLLSAAPALALDLASISSTDASSALRTALTQGASKAVATLGQTDGFFGNPEVKIPLPKNLRKVEKLMRQVGLGAKADELVLTMNRAAEAAVPEARTLLVDAVKQMTLADAKGILTGPQDAATQYFKAKTEQQLAARFRPIVAQATAKTGVASQYNALAGKAAQYGLLTPESANIDDYVTAQALNGLYKMIAKEELAIRKDPLGQSSKLLQKVFGAVAGH